MPADLPLTTCLRAAVMKYRIYPAASTTVRHAVAQLHQTLMDFMISREEIRLTRDADKMFLDEEELAGAGPVAEIFDECQVQSLRFRKGFTLEEADHLVACLSRRKGSGEKFGDALAAGGVVHIETNDRTVVQLTEDQTVVGRGFFQFQELSAEGDLRTSVQSSIDYIDKLPEETHRTHLRQQLAVRLASMKASVVLDLLEKVRIAEGADNALEQTLLGAVPSARLLEMLSEICRWAKKLGNVSSVGSGSAPDLERLRWFVSYLLKSAAADRVPRALYEDLVGQRLMDAIPEQVAVEEPLESESDRLLADSDAKFLGGTRGNGLPAFMERLLDAGLRGRVPLFLDRLCRVIREADTTLRVEAIGAAHGVQPILWENRLQEDAERLGEALRRQAEDERHAAAYRALVRALELGVLHNFRADLRGPAVATLALLRKHAAADFPLMEGRREIASGALSDILEELLDVLVGDLAGDNAERRAAAEEVMEHVGERGIRVLVGVVRSSPDTRRRQWAAERLARFPVSGAAALASELSVGNSSQVVLNVVSILHHFAGDAVLAGVAAMTYYPDPDVRRMLLRTLLRVGTGPAMEVAVRFLEDPDPPTRREAIAVMGEKKWAPAIPRLLELLKTESEEQMEAVCLALGRLKARAAVEPLQKLLIARRLHPFGRKNKQSDLLRVRAAWALAEITNVLNDRDSHLPDLAP